ncbi:adenylate/guanylate cyclase domain-containing protein [Populibacterium corticicola]|uniref:Adenylate/guanylate cyclase domain-containing protein n=1 Tax=Populibacterium corticicola TaxID=1812826 RepID=A0ABW5XFS6_9MICO
MTIPNHQSDAQPRALRDPQNTARGLEESLLQGAPIYTEAELCEATGATSAQVNDYWQTLGLPNTKKEARVFTQADADAIKSLLDLAEAEQFDHRTLTSLIRSAGHTAERLALWQAEALVEHYAHNYGWDDARARQEFLSEFERMHTVFAQQMEHAWRRQMAALVGRWFVEFGPEKGVTRGPGQLPLPRAVGFADIVSFTSQTAKMRSSELSDFVSNFEAAARDVITRAGGRVVKTIGDAVLFIADDPHTGAEVALGLANAGRSEEMKDLPQVRVSLVWGRVLSRFGDVFGTSVNLAARLSDEAKPGTVMVDQDTAALLAEDPSFALIAHDEREIQGLGSIAPVQLQHAYKPGQS